MNRWPFWMGGVLGAARRSVSRRFGRVPAAMARWLLSGYCGAVTAPLTAVAALLRWALVIDWLVRWWTVSWTPVAAAAVADETAADVVAAMLPTCVDGRRGVIDVVSVTWTAVLLLTTHVIYTRGESHINYNNYNCCISACGLRTSYLIAEASLVLWTYDEQTKFWLNWE